MQIETEVPKSKTNGFHRLEDPSDKSDYNKIKNKQKETAESTSVINGPSSTTQTEVVINSKVLKPNSDKPHDPKDDQIDGKIAEPSSALERHEASSTTEEKLSAFSEKAAEKFQIKVLCNHNANKIFICNLKYETKEENLRKYFSQFGEVETVQIFLDSKNRSKGNAFLTFSDSSAKAKVFAQTAHILDGRAIYPREAHPLKDRRVFLGGISSETTADDIKNYFEQFGPVVEEVSIVWDYLTNRHKGFAFVTFTNDNVVRNMCDMRFHWINKKKVECKNAIAKCQLPPTLPRYQNSWINNAFFPVPIAAYQQQLPMSTNTMFMAAATRVYLSAMQNSIVLPQVVQSPLQNFPTYGAMASFNSLNMNYPNTLTSPQPQLEYNNSRCLSPWLGADLIKDVGGGKIASQRQNHRCSPYSRNGTDDRQTYVVPVKLTPDVIRSPQEYTNVSTVVPFIGPNQPEATKHQVQQ